MLALQDWLGKMVVFRKSEKNHSLSRATEKKNTRRNKKGDTRGDKRASLLKVNPSSLFNFFPSGVDACLFHQFLGFNCWV